MLFVGASDGIRTRDGRNHNPGLYQLSYARHRGPRKLYRKALTGAWSGAPGGTRTPDRRIRNPLLYPAELRAHRCLARRAECITGRKPLQFVSGASAWDREETVIAAPQTPERGTAPKSTSAHRPLFLPRPG